jgi:hypothetical protein
MRYSVAFGLLLAAVVLAGDTGLDLPVHPSWIEQPATVTKVQSDLTSVLPTPPLPPPAPEPVQEDPKDEPLPVFYGEELESASHSVVFVIDISGSMNQTIWDNELGWRTPQKIHIAKRELSKAISQLPSYWTFTVLAYDDLTRIWRPTLVDANLENKTLSIAWVNALQAYGQTGTGPAVVQALEVDRENLYVVLLTDGAPNYPEPHLPDWHRRIINDGNYQRAKIDVFGIDTALQPGMRAFCVGVATDSGGTYCDAR